MNRTRTSMSICAPSILTLIVLTAIAGSGFAWAESNSSASTQIVMLGTGTPNAEANRSGSAIAIVVNDTPYIVDFGPGVIRQAVAMTPQFGGDLAALEAKNIKRAFLTHLHSDHTTGYPDLIFTPWTLGRDEPLEVYGPEGIVEMTQHVQNAWREDVRYRVYGLQPANDEGWRVNAHVVSEGVVYEDANVTVEAFPVRHGSWPNAFGYRFTTPDRSIVISGDAAPSPSIEKYSENVDVLIHEVYSAAGLIDRDDPFWQKYYDANHTSGIELGEIARRAQPKLLILYHFLPVDMDTQQIVDEIRQNFDGEVRAAEDLDVF